MLDAQEPGGEGAAGLGAPGALEVRYDVLLDGGDLEHVVGRRLFRGGRLDYMPPPSDPDRLLLPDEGQHTGVGEQAVLAPQGCDLGVSEKPDDRQVAEGG